VLDALYVALIGMFIGGPDGDDTLEARHLESRGRSRGTQPPQK
jgi:hypothetical protein